MMQKCDFYIMDELFNGLDVGGVILLKDWIVKERERKHIPDILSYHLCHLDRYRETLAYIHQGNMMKTYEEKKPFKSH